MPAHERTIPTAYRPCVGIMLLNSAGEIWIGRRAEAPNDAEGSGLWWQMPQGGVDAGEEPADAAVRELYEEVGVRNAEIIAYTEGWLNYDLPDHLLGRAWGGRFRGQTQKWFLMRFLGADNEINITPIDHPIEFDQWRWASKDELLDVIVPFKKDVYRQVLAEFDGKIAPK